MSHPKPLLPAASDGVDDIGEALRQSDRAIARVLPILGHLLSAPDQSLFSEEIVARVRGMMKDLAWQMLRAQADAAGQSGRGAFAGRHGDGLAEHLQASPALLGHCHALALEWQLTSRFEAQYGVDPVLSPLLQDQIASADASVATAAMSALAAQARFVQTQRRMELPLEELSADLFHEALMSWRAWNGPGASDVLARAESRLRNRFDESAGRLALLPRLVAGLASDVDRCLQVEASGVAMFLTGLAARSGQARERIVLSTNAGQTARLAVAMRAAGAPPAVIDDAILRFHPDRLPARGIHEIGVGEARQMLANPSDGGIS